MWIQSELYFGLGHIDLDFVFSSEDAGVERDSGHSWRLAIVKVRTIDMCRLF